MTSRDATPDDSRLPTPVARLVRQAFVTRDLKKRHDYLISAWEASFRLVVAAHPPTDAAPLAVPSMGHWRAAMQLPDARSSRPELVELVGFVRSVLGRSPSRRTKLRPLDVVDLLPSYRNRTAAAHGPPLSDDHYEAATGVLARGLVAAWEDGLLLARGAALVFVPEIELGREGEHRGRVFKLEGTDLRPSAEWVELPTHVLPGRVYVRQLDDWSCLHPWVVYAPKAVRSRFLLFNSANRGVEYLDCDSGDVVKARTLEAEGVEVLDPTQAAAGFTPLPPVARAALTSEPPPSSQVSEGPASSLAPGPSGSGEVRKKVPRWAAVGALLVASVASVGALAVWAMVPRERWALPARDWLRVEKSADGWLERCRRYRDDGNEPAARAACELALQQTGDMAVRLQASRTLCSSEAKDRLARQGALEPLELLPPATGTLLLVDPGRGAASRTVLDKPTCVVLGTPGITQKGEVWYHVMVTARDQHDKTLYDWYLPAKTLAVPSAAAHLAACRRAVNGGISLDANHACLQAALSDDAAITSEAASLLSATKETENRRSLAIEWAIVAYAGTRSPESAARIRRLCEASWPNLPAGSGEWRVVAYPWQNRLYRLRERPDMASPTIEEFPYGTCALVAGPEAGGFLRVTVPRGSKESVTGAMHEDWLFPRAATASPTAAPGTSR